MHELSVVASVLQESPEEITLRYRDFEVVEHHQDAVEFQKHAEALGRAPLPDGEMSSLHDRYKEVVDRWGGKSFTLPLAWAGPACSRPNTGIADLEDLVGLAHLRPFYRFGNHAIHGGPRAAALQRVDMDGKQLRTPGATVYADFAETAHGTIILLQQVNAALLGELRLSDALDEESVVAINTLNKMVNRCGNALVSAADVARNRGWISHSPDD